MMTIQIVYYIKAVFFELELHGIEVLGIGTPKMEILFRVIFPILFSDRREQLLNM